MAGLKKYINQINKNDLNHFAETYQRGKEAHREKARITGKISGQKNVESGHIQALGKVCGPIQGKIQGKINAKNGHMGRIGRIGGKIGGRIAAESGHLSLIGHLGGLVSGSNHAKNKTGICTPGIAAKAGRLGGLIAGRKAVESGQLASIQTTENWAKALKKLSEMGCA